MVDNLIDGVDCDFCTFRFLASRTAAAALRSCSWHDTNHGTKALNGPIGRSHSMYLCTNHKKNINFDDPDFPTLLDTNDALQSHRYTRVGDRLWTDGALIKLQLLTMDCQPAQQIRRDFAITWATTALENLETLLHELKPVLTNEFCQSSTFFVDD